MGLVAEYYGLKSVIQTTTHVLLPRTSMSAPSSSVGLFLYVVVTEERKKVWWLPCDDSSGETELMNWQKTKVSFTAVRFLKDDIDTKRWMNYFKDLRDQGLYDDSNPIHVECLKFCYMPVIKEDLDRIAQQWNLHMIRKQSTNYPFPTGRPELLFFSPEAFNSSSHLQDVDSQDLVVAKDTCCDIPQDTSFETFSELAEIIMSENNIEPPGININKVE